MNRGGLETFIMNLYRNIDRSKVQFDFLVHSNKEGAFDQEIMALGGKIFSVPSRKQGVLKYRKALADFFNTHPEYKIIHSHISSLTNVSPLRVAKKYGVPCRIVHSHNIMQGGSRIHRYIHRINQLSLKSYATHYFACSDLAAKWMYPKELYENHEFKLINNGIETEKFKFNKDVRIQKRKELGVNNNYVIGHVGRFQTQKNHSFLIDIFKEIYVKNNDCVLLLVGDGELRREIETKVKELGLTENVIFTGVRSDIPELFQAMDVFVFPSFYEGWGIVLVEAQASGLECFTSNKVVPKEVDVADLVEFVDLDKSAQVWADKILNVYSYERNNTTDIIKTGGYDICQVVEDLQKWYLSEA
jgi:glycosyltransferase involved in cell wall biosynthesis